jgi:hypothetical protein
MTSYNLFPFWYGEKVQPKKTSERREEKRREEEKEERKKSRRYKEATMIQSVYIINQLGSGISFFLFLSEKFIVTKDYATKHDMLMVVYVLQI